MKEKLKSYKELIVWQKAMNLVEQVYRLTTRFPKKEMFGLTSQIRRAAISIPANIAEGQARNSTKEFIHFLSYALGSKAELETQFEIAMRLQFISIEEINPIVNQCEEIGKMLNGLMKKLKLVTNH